MLSMLQVVLTRVTPTPHQPTSPPAQPPNTSNCATTRATITGDDAMAPAWCAKQKPDRGVGRQIRSMFGIRVLVRVGVWIRVLTKWHIHYTGMAENAYGIYRYIPGIYHSIIYRYIYTSIYTHDMSLRCLCAL